MVRSAASCAARSAVPASTEARRQSSLLRRMKVLPSSDTHQAMKVEAKWRTLKYVGVQEGWGDLPSLELRDCDVPGCGSTLVRELPAKEAA